MSIFARKLEEMMQVLIPLYRAEQRKADGDQGAVDRLVAEALAAAGKARAGQRHFLAATIHTRQENYKQAVIAFKRYLAAGGERARAGLLGFVGLKLLSREAGRAAVRDAEVQTHEHAFTFMLICRAYPEAREHLATLEQLAGQDWWAQQDHPWESLCDCGELYEGLDDLATAIDFYDKAIAQFEERRGRLARDELKTALAGNKGAQRLYLFPTRTALKLHEAARQCSDWEQAGAYASAAFQYGERGRARALLDLMAAGATMTKRPIAQSEDIVTWRRLTNRLSLWQRLLAQERKQDRPDADHIADLNARIEAEQAELGRVEARIAASNPQFYRAVNPQASTITLVEVAAQLPAGTAMIEYFLGPKDLLAWTITTDGMVQTLRTTLELRAFERQVRAFHRACEGCGRADALGDQLAHTLLVPFAEAIRANPRLLIVPYGATHILPFHALPWEGQPLAATHTISYLPSASVLPFLRAAPFGLPERLLAVGNPAHMSHQASLGEPRHSAPDLPAAEIEAAYVASLFPAGEALLGERATEEAVTARLSRFPLLHLATHGYLSAEAPLLSSILLANGEELSLYELMGLRLDADLVVLSACRTAEGETTGGDEVLGLTRGLLAAGARAAIVSLWPVDDLATSLLMGHFYQRLRAGDAPAMALQAAQNYLRMLSEDQIAKEIGVIQAALTQVGASTAALEAVDAGRAARNLAPIDAPARRDGYSHPRYWAPFVLVGV